MDTVRFTGDFSKVDAERRLVFGWAYVMTKDGETVVDHSGDFVDKAAQDDLEAAVYDYVLHSREADEMHVVLDGVAKLVEAIVLTPEKAEAMGVTTDQYGVWCGFKVQDDDVWAKVKDGTYRMFSIRGVGDREEVHA